MKITYEMPEFVNDAALKIKEVAQKTPPELMEIVQPVMDMAEHFYLKSMEQFFEIEKWKLMWRLRHLEADIESEGGTLTLTKDGGLSLDGFSEELLKKIGQAVKKDVQFS